MLGFSSPLSVLSFTKQALQGDVPKQRRVQLLPDRARFVCMTCTKEANSRRRVQNGTQCQQEDVGHKRGTNVLSQVFYPLGFASNDTKLHRVGLMGGGLLQTRTKSINPPHLKSRKRSITLNKISFFPDERKKYTSRTVKTFISMRSWWGRRHFYFKDDRALLS